MGLLKWFNKETYKGLGEVLQAIRKELQALQPTDSQDIVWNKTANGMSASLRNSNTGSGLQNEIEDATNQPVTSEYNGYFKIVAVPVTGTNGQPTGQIEVRIVDGATYNPETGTSGYNFIKINGLIRRLEAFKSTPLSVGTYTFFVQYDAEHTPQPWFITHQANALSDDNPTPPNNSEVIGEVKILDDGVTIRQCIFGLPHLFVFAPCGVPDDGGTGA